MLPGNKDLVFVSFLRGASPLASQSGRLKESTREGFKSNSQAHVTSPYFTQLCTHDSPYSRLQREIIV